jgi:hypothetical protein
MVTSLAEARRGEARREAKPAKSIGVKLLMISTNTFMFVWLEKGLNISFE